MASSACKHVQPLSCLCPELVLYGYRPQTQLSTHSIDHHSVLGRIKVWKCAIEEDDGLIFSTSPPQEVDGYYRVTNKSQKRMLYWVFHERLSPSSSVGYRRRGSLAIGQGWEDKCIFFQSIPINSSTPGLDQHYIVSTTHH